jgi:hypothetical protein
LKVTYTEEAVADIVQAITYLNERNPTAAAYPLSGRAPGLGHLRPARECHRRPTAA